MAKKPATMSPPPPGAHEGERPRRTGFGPGLLVGALVGVALVAATLAVVQLVRPSATQLHPTPSTSAPPRSAAAPATAPALPTLPGVTQAVPLDNATGVPADAAVVLTFATDMIPATLSAETIAVFDAARGANVASELSFTYQRDTRQLTIAHLVPTVTWGSGNSIDVEVTTGATDVAGRTLATAFRMTFSTR